HSSFHIDLLSHRPLLGCPLADTTAREDVTVRDDEFWAARFEEHRPRLRAVAYRMLGSFAEAEDALQEAWLRVAHAADDDVANIGGWLSTIVSRQCLNMLRTRTNRREDSLDVRVPDPAVAVD